MRDVGYSERAIFTVDHEGALRYQQVYESGVQPDNDEILAQVRAILPPGRLPAERAQEPEAEQPRERIVMYCSAYCGDCRKARTWLAENKLKYTEIDVYRVEGASDKVRAWNDDDLVLPTFEIEGRVLSNFEPEALAALLSELGVRADD